MEVKWVLDVWTAVYLGFFLALGACLGMVSFELIRRLMKTAAVALTAATSAVASWVPKGVRK